MFQNFDTESAPQQAQARLQALRAQMKALGLDAFLVPHSDEYQGEYLPPCSQRLAWLTGFDGSAGFAIIAREEAALFVDGRYTLQARQQTDPLLFSYHDLIAMPPARRLRGILQAQAAAGLLPAGGAAIGFDPWLHSIKEAAALRAAIAPHGQLRAVEQNPLDAIWHDRPPPPQSKITLRPLRLAGRPAADKLAEIRAKTAAAGAKACLLAEPAALAWAFNLRGRDVAHIPVALGFALIPAAAAEKAILFLNAAPPDAETTAELAPLADLAPLSALSAAVKACCADKNSLMVDSAGAAEAFRLMAEQAGGAIIAADNPVSLPRAIKTPAEQEGARKAHLRDGVAVVRFLAWLDAAAAAGGSLDEITAVEKLEECRRQTAAEMGSRLEDISFDTIAGAGANGAIIHYRVTRAGNRKLQQGELFLVDSGGQYQDGTTDITRTIAIGAAGAEEKRCFTLVLKGMIALSAACFPQGARGCDLDAIARYALWQNGLDYAHGTGHGVGSFLSVHEGPQNISRRGGQELFAGMILSNEPGYYREGAFGIRLENLLIVRPAEAVKGGDSPMLRFETLTLCPIDRRLILPELLSAAELAWLNAYHARVYAQLAPFLRGRDKDWLAAATKSL